MICSKCHHWMRKRVWAHSHRKKCVPTQSDIERYLISRSGSSRRGK